MQHHHSTPLIDLRELPVLWLWAAATAAGFALVWDRRRRCVVCRPITGRTPA